MSDKLAEICAATRLHVARCRGTVPLPSVEREALAADRPRGFVHALRSAVEKGRIGLIAEIKKASPSRGLIRADFDPASLAMAYEAGGATCLSVLTDEPYFQGALGYLSEARAAVRLPVLRKDFIVDRYQIFEARAAGADAILLIMAALSDDEAVEFERCANDLGMDVLVEVHDEPELDRALGLASCLIGVNNRDLKTLRVDLSTTERLSRFIPEDRMLVCESGIGTPADIARMKLAGAGCFLVGESLMRQPDVTSATAALLARVMA